MKNRKSIALCSALLTIFISAFFIQQYSESFEKLPADIGSFYRDFNFVSSFSTPKERSGLTPLAKLPSEDRPKQPLPARLRKVQEIAGRIRDRIWRIDPGIVASKLLLKNQVLPAELVKIDNLKINKDELFVRVTAYSIGPRVNLILVAQYENYAGDESRIPSLQERLELLQAVTPRSEIHHWVKIDGSWVLKEAKVVLLLHCRDSISHLGYHLPHNYSFEMTWTKPRSSTPRWASGLRP